VACKSAIALYLLNCLCVLSARTPRRKRSAVFQETAIFIEQQKRTLGQGSLQARFAWSFSKTRQLITGKCSQYKNIFYTYMKIPKIQWDFFLVEHRTFSVDSFFMSLSSQTPDHRWTKHWPPVHGPVNSFWRTV